MAHKAPLSCYAARGTRPEPERWHWKTRNYFIYSIVREQNPASGESSTNEQLQLQFNQGVHVTNELNTSHKVLNAQKL